MPKPERRSACGTLLAESERLLEGCRGARGYEDALLQHCRASIAHSRLLLSLPFRGADKPPIARAPGDPLPAASRRGT